MTIRNQLHDTVFHQIHGRRLIYNACWEDPRIDRQLLDIDSRSKIVVITSAGCNTLDYLLDEPDEIHAVDMNPRQNAVLDLKLALIEQGMFDELFLLFGKGAHPEHEAAYQAVRGLLPQPSRDFWDKKLDYFNGRFLRKSYYYYGASGEAAWMVRLILWTHQNIARYVNSLLDAPTLDQQRQIYDHMEPVLWSRFTKWLVNRPTFMALLGVPRPQIGLIDNEYPGGMEWYLRDHLSNVATEIAMNDNYFYRVYLTGSYTAQCSPNYLKKENFDTLRRNRSRVQTHTSTIAQFLADHPGEYSHFILLDHQDWLAYNAPDALSKEWELILKNSAPGSKVLMRSAGRADAGFLPQFVHRAVQFFPHLTEPIHLQDRVGTYRSLHLAEVL